MAIVYRASDSTLKREVAIKILHHHLASEPESKARLEREAQAVAKLRHENILEIFDYSGINSPSSYIVTEFIDGPTLKQWLNDHQPSHPEVAALIAAEMSGALVHAHSVGIIHRDIKPENVMVRKDGLLKLMDFGIAQVVDLQRMTVTGQLLGSPAYMAPELIEGKPLDFRTDVFSIGIMLYQLATGSLPFSGKNPHEVLRRIGEGKFPDPRTLNREIGDGLSRIISRALARNPDDRYATVALLAGDLIEYLAEAGLTDVRSELRAYFSDPDGYEKALTERMASALVAGAERQLEAGRSARAMELWNRVLAFNPQHAGVLAALQKLEGRTRLKNAALVVAIVAGIGGMTWGIARLRPTPGPRPRPAVVASAPPVVPLPTMAPTPPAKPGEPTINPAPNPAPKPAPARPGGPALEAAPIAAADRRPDQRPRPGHGPGHPSASNASGEAEGAGGGRTFLLGPTPQNVDVYLDGERQFAYDPDHKSLAVPWPGNHVIEFRSPSGCCFVERIELGPDRPLPTDNIIARRLKWRPARLLVTTEPEIPNARIIVKDPSRGGKATPAKPGEDISVPFLSTDEADKEIEIGVDTGDAFTSERVTVRAGQRLTHVVKVRTSKE
ncbi:MAG: eukaryotic-like serine/threonine-protein kinase [Myxococcales bacterium]|jgi:serine/threonine-protein kinase|nr:eukaryotic-like serine/threonine-protein kinase [Myxococcales bacterium]